MESDSESRSNSSIKSLTKSPKNIQDTNNDCKESNSEGESLEKDLHQNNVSEIEKSECDSMAVDKGEVLHTSEPGELQNGSKDVTEFQHKEAKRKSSHPTKISSQRSTKRESVESSDSVEPDSTAAISSSSVTEKDGDKEDEKMSVDSEVLDLATSSTTDADSKVHSKSEELTKPEPKKESSEEGDNTKMDVDAAEHDNHVGGSEDADSADKESSSAESKSSQKEKTDAVDDGGKASDTRDTDTCEEKKVVKQEDNTEHAEPAEKTSPKEKGIGIDAIAKKLCLQVNNESTKEPVKEESEDIKKVDTKTKDSVEESVSPDSKTKVSSSEKTEVKSEKKKKKKRNCEECNAKQGLRFQVLFQSKMRFFCSDTCLKNFKEKHKTSMVAPATPPPPSPAAPPTPRAPTPPPPSPVDVKTFTTDSCSQCKKTMKDGKGYYPMIGAIKPLCSTDCLVTYQEYNIPKKKCSQCKIVMEDEISSLTWETMEFCNEDCLGKFQSFLGSHCTCCQSPVQQTSLGKYCVCFGADIRQFCSGSCLEEFKKGLKVCSYCQKDLSTNTEGFLAPVGDKAQFKDFCSQLCMEGYECMYARLNAPPKTEDCGYCKKTGIYKIHVSHEGKSAGICSDNCVSGYRYVQKISLKVCDTCYKFFKSELEKEFHLQFEGVNKFFCTKACMTLFMMTYRKIIPCSWCKVKKYNFDMIEKLDSSHQMQTYCSLNCISLFRVSLSATSAKSIRCDNCTKTLPAQFHLTMSDGSIRNFCTYQCVVQFQNQFTNAPTLTTSTASTRQSSSTTQSPAAKTTASGLTPVISSVVSLATTNPRPPNLGIAKIVNPPKGMTATATRSSHPSITILTTKSQSTSQTATTMSSASTNSISSSSTGPQVIREIIVKPPQPKSVKNKAVICKPIMQTKAISCRPHPCHKAVQTDEGLVPTIVPVPVPVYIPTPVHMFSRPVPVPVPFPIPIPVPIFIPLSKDSPLRVMQQLRDLQEKVSTSPYEADLLMMAEMVADNEEKKDKAVKEDESKENKKGEEPAEEDDDIHLDVEAELPPGIAPVLHKGIIKEPENLEDDIEYVPKEGRHGKRSASGRGRGRGKRARVDVIPLDEPEDYPGIPLLDDPSVVQQADASDTSLRLKHTFGVNAWKHWVLQKNAQLEKGSQSSRKFKLFKTDLLQLPHDELNYSLCLFVKEVRKPTGEEYAPASIYYLCLGIQQYLFENGRIDNMFTDTYYEKFTECLNDVLVNQVDIMSSEGFFVSRIEEEILWESKQLGAHSPHVLLNTLMFFNTKYFNLKAIDDHIHLSFSHITKHWRKTSLKSGPRNVVLRYYPPLNKEWQRRRKDESTYYEQNESLENPLRCPVKLYEFYMSKCPESVKARNDVFYLYPERSCVPDSPVWYSTQPLAREVITKMLQRIKAVREIYET